jgi:lycopene cyclase domain-containing protein
VLSFDKKVHFYKRWKYLFPSIAITALIFIPWDHWFTVRGVWGFNPTHLSGIYIFSLPLEEWLFFLTVPYASVFIYDVLRYYFERNFLNPYRKVITDILIILLAVTGIIYHARMYTFVTFIAAAIFLFFIRYVFRFEKTGWFYLAYLVILIPFLLVNGLLTGSFIHQEVVWYNNAENTGIRLFTIPVEDIFYGMLLILLNVFLYETFMKMDKQRISNSTYSCFSNNPLV